MRKLIVCLLLGFFWFHPLSGQSLLHQQVSLTAKNISLKTALQILHKQYNIPFTYSSKHAAFQKKINLKAKRKPLSKVLDQLLSGLPLQYKEIGTTIVLGPKQLPKMTLSRSNHLPPPPKIRKQTVRGKVVDVDSKNPLIGANIYLLDSAGIMGTSTDINGEFALEQVPIGRRSFEITYIGYESNQVNNISVISGKETYLEVALLESTTNLNEVVVTTAGVDKMVPLNDMATVSTHPVRIEELQRFPASFLDPVRMLQVLPGVSSINDLTNQLIIRGNPPISMLWRLEGIEIPNPHHFTQIGNSGGAISMLSISTMAHSEFMTGAFPAEYGNTVSGVFDLRLRNGNKEKRESSIMVGSLGLEVSSEGPIGQNSQASYLFNYRYSTLSFLELLKISPVPEGSVPRFQDLTFKINMPTARFGTFSLFGIAAESNQNIQELGLEEDVQVYDIFSDEVSGYGSVGFSHFFQLTPQSYIKSIVSTGIISYVYDYSVFDTLQTQRFYQEEEDFFNHTMRASLQFNHKFDAKNIIRAGAIGSLKGYDLNFEIENQNGFPNIPFNRFALLDEAGYVHIIQSYFQWKHRFRPQWTLNTGLHHLYFSHNQEHSIEPRMALRWQFTPKSSLALGTGLHSYTNEMTSYLFRYPLSSGGFRQPFLQTELPKALHTVLSYENRLRSDLWVKIEAYFQHIYNVPVGEDPSNTWLSMLNIVNYYDYFTDEVGIAVNEGKGRNIGLELTFEKFFTRGNYFLFTGSLYDSKYALRDGTFYNTRFNGNFTLNLLGGKEYYFRTNNVLRLNAKLIYAGGNRISPIDEDLSRAFNRTVRIPDQVNAVKSKNYFRIDASVSYEVNRPKKTHTFLMEIQNIFNRDNIDEFYFNPGTQKVTPLLQSGIIPNINYRFAF